jgi:hypothetical protein
MHKTLTAAALSLLFAAGTFAAEPVSVPSRPVTQKLTAKSFQSKPLATPQSAPSLRVKLPALAADELSKSARGGEKFTRIGIGRTSKLLEQGISLSSLAWNTVGTTHYATLEIESTTALAMRIGVAGRQLPKGVTLYISGSAAPDRLYGPFGSSELRRHALHWLPAVEGDVARIELRFEEGVPLDDKALVIPKISHLFASLRNDNLLKDLRDVGESGSCNIDVACAPDASTWMNRGLSVSKYIVTTQTGDSGACSGTLLNSTASGTPNYFLTANHCVGTLAEAASMHFYWFFRRATCGGPAPTSVTESLGGATFLKTVPANDATLVQVNGTLPPGTVLAAWTTSPLITSEQVFGLHHPAGDLMKYSAGSQQGFTPYYSNTTNSTASHVRVQWSAGTTEGGSSGSALFNAAGQVVASLHGGEAACSRPTAVDWYGRFDQAYVELQPWLTPGPGGPPPPEAPPPPTIVDIVSGVPITSSVTESEDKYYRIQTSSPNNGLTITLTNLSADADLYVFRDSLATAPVCESEEAGVVNDTCNVTSTTTTTWYINVYGFAAADFTLTATATSASPPPVSNNGGGNRGGGAIDSMLAALLSFLLALRYLHRGRGSRHRGNA